MNPSSGVSLRARLARVSEGEGDAKRKAGLIECKESFLLRPHAVQGLSAGSGMARRGQTAGARGGPTEPGTSKPRGVVFGGRHIACKSEECSILSNTSLVLCVHMNQQGAPSGCAGQREVLTVLLHVCVILGCEWRQLDLCGISSSRCLVRGNKTSSVN